MTWGTLIVLFPRTSNLLDTQWVQSEHLLHKYCSETCHTDQNGKPGLEEKSLESSLMLILSPCAIISDHSHLRSCKDTNKCNVILNFKSNFEIHKFLFQIDDSYASWQQRFVVAIVFLCFSGLHFTWKRWGPSTRSLETDQSIICCINQLTFNLFQWISKEKFMNF